MPLWHVFDMTCEGQPLAPNKLPPLTLDLVAAPHPNPLPVHAMGVTGRGDSRGTKCDNLRNGETGATP